jgi:hypothetical protein
LIVRSIIWLPAGPVVIDDCRAGLSGAGLTDFADDVADLVAAADGKGGSSSLAAAFGKQRLSQQYGADLASQQARVSAIYQSKLELSCGIVLKVEGVLCCLCSNSFPSGPLR